MHDDDDDFDAIFMAMGNIAAKSCKIWKKTMVCSIFLFILLFHCAQGNRSVGFRLRWHFVASG